MPDRSAADGLLRSGEIAAQPVTVIDQNLRLEPENHVVHPWGFPLLGVSGQSTSYQRMSILP